MEEIDLCWRAKNSDYDIKYIGTSLVYHVGGATLKNSHPRKTYLNFRNSLYNLVKNANGNILFLVLIRLILDGIAGIKFIFEFKFVHFLSIIKAHFKFYGHLPSLIKQRKNLSQTKSYFSVKSIVWSYFIRGKRIFNRL